MLLFPTETMIVYFLLASLTCASAKQILVGPDEQAWRDWKVKFGKFYETDQEESVRKVIWTDNVKKVDLHNLDVTKTYKMGVNHLSDLTENEYKKYATCLKIPRHLLVNGSKLHDPRTPLFLKPENVRIPDSVDWRSQGYVTPVKNQGQCGSCWAFSSTGSLEGQHFRKTGNLVSLSEQNLVDCSGSYGTEGCNGGWMDDAFKYIRDNKGIDTEAGYPYYARQLGYCYFNNLYVGATDVGLTDIASGDEEALKEAVATVGPISVAIDATHSSFSGYTSGVYVEPQCGNAISSLDHAVLVVGYGTENGQDYWLVKNSWGSYWGDGGYIKMARNLNNQCGIATKASYPNV